MSPYNCQLCGKEVECICNNYNSPCIRCLNHACVDLGLKSAIERIRITIEDNAGEQRISHCISWNNALDALWGEMDKS